MKTTGIFLALPFAAFAAVARLEPRQFGDLGGLGGLVGSLANSFVPKAKTFKVEELTPRHPAAKRIRVTWGPYKVKGLNSTTKAGNSMSMDKDGTGYNLLAGSDFPSDVTLLDGIVEIHNKEGKRLTLDDNIYTHHFLVVDMAKPQKPSFTCDNGQQIRYVPLPGSVIVGGAAEDAEAHYATTKVLADKKTGYYVKKDATMFMAIDIVNSNPADIDVYPTADLEFIAGRPADYLDASAVFLPVTGCEAKDFLPGIVQTPRNQKKWTLNSKGVIAAEDAVLYLFRGHMHDGGSNIEVRVNDNLACDSEAMYGGKGHVGRTADGKTWQTIGNMKTCPEGVIVRKGDRISMTANYDLEAHPSREGGGGGMLGQTLGMLMGGDGGHAEQMAVMIVFVAPLNKS